MLFNLSINDLDEWVERRIIKFTDDSKLRGPANNLGRKIHFKKIYTYFTLGPPSQTKQTNETEKHPTQNEI